MEYRKRRFSAAKVNASLAHPCTKEPVAIQSIHSVPVIYTSPESLLNIHSVLDQHYFVKEYCVLPTSFFRLSSTSHHLMMMRFSKVLRIIGQQPPRPVKDVVHKAAQPRQRGIQGFVYQCHWYDLFMRDEQRFQVGKRLQNVFSFSKYIPSARWRTERTSLASLQW